MVHDPDLASWSPSQLALIESSLWQVGPDAATDYSWLHLSWKQPAAFFKDLHSYWQRRQASQSKSIPGLRYDFYHDLLTRQKDQSQTALIWYEKGAWQRWSYAELTHIVNGLAATWEAAGVQPGEVLAIIQPNDPQWLSALLAGFRLGLVVSIIPPQGNAFVQRRLKELAPNRLVIDHLYRHQLGSEWQALVLPSQLSSISPVRQPYIYPEQAVVLQCFDPVSVNPQLPVPVTAETLYFGALRDGVFALGIKPGDICAAPGWHRLESQPSMVLAVLLSGATWLHITLAELSINVERLLEQPVNVLGISAGLRDLLLRKPPVGEIPWRYWFRHPAESSDFILWQDFIQRLQLQSVYAGNALFSAVYGGAILFSARQLGQAHLCVLPAAGITWQLSMIDSPDLPCLGGWGRLALGRVAEAAVSWEARPYLCIPESMAWHYLGQHPQSRAGHTYPREEVLELLAATLPYVALVEAYGDRGGADPRQILLVFGTGFETVDIEALIAAELGAEFLPDRIEVLPFLPRRDKTGHADQAWCQAHYLSGELYRRQRSSVHLCLSELKQKILTKSLVNLT